MTTVSEEKSPSKNGKVKRGDFGRFELLPLKELHSDGTYQRPVSAWAVNHIVFNYRAILYQPLIIGLRKGVYYIIDGQHRKEAGLELGFTVVPCMVYDTISAAEEAKAFFELQKFRRRITATQQLMARAAYKDPTAVAILDSLVKYKFEIDKYDAFAVAKRNNVINATGVLEWAYDQGGLKLLDNTLSVLRSAWDGRAAALDATIIRGLVIFMRDHPYSIRALSSKLGEMTPYNLLSAARSVSNQYGITEGAAMARVIFNLYRDAPLKAKVME